jgi:hypothetical protein
MQNLKQKKQSEDATNPLFLELFAKCSGTDDREQEWRRAIAHVGGGMEPMRFPAYESPVSHQRPVPKASRFA